jgi:signal transduction histidine kinase
VDISLVGDAQAICLMIEDDGRGLPSDENRGTGMGLRIMSHRAAFIGGTLSLIPTTNQGTRVICHLPRARGIG